MLEEGASFAVLQYAFYQLVIERGLRGDERLAFTPIAVDPIAARLRKRGLNASPGENL